MEEANGGEVKEEASKSTSSTTMKGDDTVDLGKDEKKAKVDLEGNPDSLVSKPEQSNGTQVTTTCTESQKENEECTDATKPSASTAESCTSSTDVASEEKKAETVEPKELEPEIELKIVFNKQQLPIRISPSQTVGDLKKKIEQLTKVSPALQKVLIKGIPKDDVVLKTLSLSNGSKVMVIGSSLDAVMSVAKPPDVETLTSESGSSNNSGGWCTMPQHKKIIDKGIPDDAMPGIMNVTDPLPPFPLHGMVTSKGYKVRLTFKLESDELWIGTKERTEKLQISTIRNVTTEPITGYEHYHIMAIQLGPTSASNFFIYWVPAQYIEAIKDVLGA